jgi:hypothetical protein
MSIKKEDLIYKKEDVVKVDYSNEIEWKSLSKKQKVRQGRLAIITNIIEKKIIKKFSCDYDYLYRYEVIVGKEKIEIDQSCIVAT